MRHSIYLHIPFCTHRCAYCDFNTYAGQESAIPAYVAALCREVEYVGEEAPRDVTIHTVFFGGGTPSLLLPQQVRTVLDTIRSTFRVEDDAEVTLETNPGTVSAAALRSLLGAGVNRISLGVQSTNGEELHMLERAHSFRDVLDAVSAVRRAGFVNLNTDLIYGLPEQTMETWQATVRRVLGFHPEHISAYALTLEQGTPFGQWARWGLLPPPDPDLAADMYEWLDEELRLQGYAQYEISNWAQDGRECRHNLQYWRGGPYLGFGAGAHGYTDGYRYSNVLAIKSYIERLSEGGPDPREEGRGSEPGESEFAPPPQYPCSPAAISQHRQSSEDDMSEFMIMGLRLTREGISVEEFQRRFSQGLFETYGPRLTELTQLGLLEWAECKAFGNEDGVQDARGKADKIVRLTRRGRLLGNRVFSEFVGLSATV
jgi:oxygen-independent coproporphyrinogen-3 oxidase